MMPQCRRFDIIRKVDQGLAVLNFGLAVLFKGLEALPRCLPRPFTLGPFFEYVSVYRDGVDGVIDT